MTEVLRLNQSQIKILKTMLKIELEHIQSITSGDYKGVSGYELSTRDPPNSISSKDRIAQSTFSENSQFLKKNRLIIPVLTIKRK